MQKLRPFVAAILGLTLLVQGVAIAAAPIASAEAADSAAQMPCHGDPAATVSPCDCCDGDCVNMTGCVVGSFVAGAAIAVSTDPPAHAAIAARAWPVKTALPPLPLRPPITSHA